MTEQVAGGHQGSRGTTLAYEATTGGRGDAGPPWWSGIKGLILSDRGARWASRLLLIVLWQLAGLLTTRFPTPEATISVLVDEFQKATDGSDWSLWSNQLVSNVGISMFRTAVGMLTVVAVGIPVGYAMGRWWRAQAFFTDLVTVGIALPAYIWALLGVMWFGFGLNAPVFVVFVSATPVMIIHVMQGSLAIPRELQDMSGAYNVSFTRRMKDFLLPSMAASIITGFRLSFLGGWGLVMLVEWFGESDGVGQRARLWYDSAVFDGLMAWGLVIIIIVILFDRVVVERIDQRVHRWRGSIVGFSGSSGKKAG